MRPIRVLIITDEMEVGGTQRQIAMLLKRIDRSRFEPELVYFRNRSVLVDEIVAAGIPVTQIEKNGRIDILFVRRLSQFLRKGRFDVIHCFSFTGELWGAVARLLAGHGQIVGSIRGVYEWYGRLQWRIKRWVTDRSYCVVANSHAGAKYAAAQMGRHYENKIRVVYNGVPEKQILSTAEQVALRAELGIAPLTFVTLFVGRLVDHKNLASLVRAAAILRNDPKDHQILLAGEGPQRSLLTKSIDESGCTNIRLLGQREDIDKLLQIADVLVLPSFREGLSNAILEAMSAGTPVVATSVGGNVELLQNGKTGLLYPSNDHEALAHHLSQLMENPERRTRLSTAARHYAIEHFTPRQMVSQMEEIYMQASKRPLSH